MPLDFRKEILTRHKISIGDKYTERIWDILLSTGLVSPVIGFGNSGKLTLTNDGYQLMNKFGSYSAFLEAMQKDSRYNSKACNCHSSLYKPRMIMTMIIRRESMKKLSVKNRVLIFEQAYKSTVWQNW